MHSLQQLLPIAVGMAISPLPIVAIIAIVLSKRGRTAAPAFAATFFLVSLVFTAIGALTTASVAGDSTGPSEASKIITLVLTIALTAGFAALAVASWLTRPKHGATPKTPGWLAAVDTMTPVRAAGLGLLMAATNSKNIPLELKGGSLIGAAQLELWIAALLGLALVLVGTLTLTLPTILAATGRPAIVRALERLKTEMISHNAIIMTVLFAILAANEGAHLIHQLAG